MPPSKNWDDFKKVPLPLGMLIHYKLCFERADKDKSGKLDIAELGEWSQRMGLKNVTFEHLQEMIKQVDSNHNGKVEFWEFLAIQLFASLNLQETVDFHEFVKFLTQQFGGIEKL
eukprot:TRINITY_DN77285_c0_g1_i1.p1 TRINITY_DN77285_c0_g1~~TRINITY_DN77285_c0_g1_i1.p1  ORF type:complete len:115 (-),score=15.71 TRINITY_DN77285_c0_g1_i1:677-1021(-)